jgi:hypothetical protein
MSKLAISKANGPHLTLSRLVGRWTGNTQTWFEKEVLADESPMTATITLILDDRFISMDYVGSLGGKPFEGKMIWGFSLGTQQCECSWMDTFHMGTGMMYAAGTETERGFTVLGSYGGADMPEPWGWRTELELISSDQFLIRAYNISPQGEEAKATETRFNRL